MPLPNEVFVSHSTVDEQYAQAITANLKKNNVKHFYSPVSIRNGQPWQKEIGKALKRCDWFIVLVSRNSIESMWVDREVQYALQKKQYDGRITSIILDGSDVEDMAWTLSLFQSTAWTPPNNNNCLQQLFQTWGMSSPVFCPKRTI